MPNRPMWATHHGICRRWRWFGPSNRVAPTGSPFETIDPNNYRAMYCPWWRPKPPFERSAGSFRYIWGVVCIYPPPTSPVCSCWKPALANTLPYAGRIQGKTTRHIWGVVCIYPPSRDGKDGCRADRMRQRGWIAVFRVAFKRVRGVGGAGLSPCCRGSEEGQS